MLQRGQTSCKQFPVVTPGWLNAYAPFLDILTDTFMSCLCISSLDEQGWGWGVYGMLPFHSLITHKWLADG